MGQPENTQALKLGSYSPHLPIETACQQSCSPWTSKLCQSYTSRPAQDQTILNLRKCNSYFSSTQLVILTVELHSALQSQPIQMRNSAFHSMALGFRDQDGNSSQAFWDPYKDLRHGRQIPKNPNTFFALEKEMATIPDLAWKNSMDRGALEGCSLRDHKESHTTE